MTWFAALTPGELTQMQNVQSGSMPDTCLILAHSAGSQNAYGELTPTYTAGAALACGYSDSGRDLMLADKTVIKTDGLLRLPIDTTIGIHDRIQITHRFGSALAVALTFEVAGPVRRGPSGLLVDLLKLDL